MCLRPPRSTRSAIRFPSTTLFRSDVDVDLHMFGPVARLHAGLMQHPATDVDDLACVLGQWNELGWADEAELWAMPPYQCFETDDVLAARVDDGLKLQLELVARQCPTQGRLQPQAQIGRAHV